MATIAVKLNRSIYITGMNLPYSLLNKIRVSVLLVLILTLANSTYGENTYEDNTYEFLKREYSLSKPYQGKRETCHCQKWHLLEQSRLVI